MNLSPPTHQTSLPTDETLQSRMRNRDRSAVIENDWVPAITPSEMHHATPVRLAGPLRPMWYVQSARNLVFKVVRLKRQTV